MKNLINIPIEKLDNLHFKEKITDRNPWYYKSKGDHDVDGVSPYTLTRRIIKNNIGKSFDLAFSYYCTKVPKYQQHIFLREFKDSCWNKFYIDDKGLIQNKDCYKKPKKSFYITSIDYQIELRHKLTGHKKDDFQPIYDIKYFDKYTSRKLLYYIYQDRFRMKPLHEQYIARNEDFEPVIIKGWCKEFNSKKHREYKRHQIEKYKAQNKNKRKKKVIDLEKQFDFLTKKEKLIKEERAQNLIKIIKHGFDPIESFRKDKEN